MNYDVVIFDLDGTLIDSIRDIGAAANHALALHGFPQKRKRISRSGRTWSAQSYEKRPPCRALAR